MLPGHSAAGPGPRGQHLPHVLVCPSCPAGPVPQLGGGRLRGGPRSESSQWHGGSGGCIGPCWPHWGEGGGLRGEGLTRVSASHYLPARVSVPASLAAPPTTSTSPRPRLNFLPRRPMAAIASVTSTTPAGGGGRGGCSGEGGGCSGKGGCSGEGGGCSGKGGCSGEGGGCRREGGGCSRERRVQ